MDGTNAPFFYANGKYYDTDGNELVFGDNGPEIAQVVEQPAPATVTKDEFGEFGPAEATVYLADVDGAYPLRRAIELDDEGNTKSVKLGRVVVRNGTLCFDEVQREDV